MGRVNDDGFGGIEGGSIFKGAGETLTPKIKRAPPAGRALGQFAVARAWLRIVRRVRTFCLVVFLHELPPFLPRSRAGGLPLKPPALTKLFSPPVFFPEFVVF